MRLTPQLARSPSSPFPSTTPTSHTSANLNIASLPVTQKPMNGLGWGRCKKIQKKWEL